MQCRVLDCDTINQVKSKILDALYKNTPHTLRPSIHEVDLGERRAAPAACPSCMFDPFGRPY